jgi:site-specific recombinase XerD
VLASASQHLAVGCQDFLFLVCPSARLSLLPHTLVVALGILREQNDLLSFCFHCLSSNKEQVMSPLRQRMTADMELRNFSESTKEAYLRAVEQLAKFYGKSPDRLTKEQIRKYLVYLVKEKRVANSTYIQHLCALRFFYRNTLKRSSMVDSILFPKEEERLPIVLSMDEVQQFFDALGSLKYRAILMTAYAAGLRVSEVVALRVSDIDSSRMLIRIDQGKGRKDRYVPLASRALEVLREYWKAARPKDFLFPSHGKSGHLTRKSVWLACKRAMRKAGSKKNISPHTLRHSFATHAHENGTSIRVLQMLLGHRSLRTTGMYTKVSEAAIQSTASPLDLMDDRNDSKTKDRKGGKKKS